MRYLLFVLISLNSFAAPLRDPGKRWENRRSSTWSADKLKAARAYAGTIKTAAVMIIQDGAIVDEWGDNAKKYLCHSMRKSMLSALYGIHVEQGKINLEGTLDALGIDDNVPALTKEEKQATVRDLIRARSGVYHPALAETPGMKRERPERWSHAPGTFWYYNNWDFNVLGTIFETLTKTRIWEEFDRRIAKPVGMEDFEIADGTYQTGADSKFQAYPIKMSARDLARFGHLFLRKGAWQGKQLVPANWVDESTRTYSETGGLIEGYGYMWWVGRNYYTAAGAGGHFVTVVPAMDLVVVHRVDTFEGKNSVSNAEYLALLHKIADAGGHAGLIGEAKPVVREITFSAPPRSVNPVVKRVVEEVSEERIIATLKKLETFGTRNIFSDTSNAETGIGAARKWIATQFQSYSPRLEVAMDAHQIKKAGRVFRDVEVVNVVATLKGRINPGSMILVSGHYDSLNQVYKKPQTPGAPGAANELDNEATATAYSPGVNDDGSGTAAVMELARVMSQYEWDNTLVFVAFAGEEYGLLGSNGYAENAKKNNLKIMAVLNNDIIGSEVRASGANFNRRVDVFSDDPPDGVSRQLARYIHETAERYFSPMHVNLIFRRDRFGRGGDHTSLHEQGFAAVRFTTPAEDYNYQHKPADTFENMAPAYTTRVARTNAAALASLALAPKPPTISATPAAATGSQRRSSNVQRGRTGSDAILRWRQEEPEPDLAGYAIVMRNTTAAFWEREIFVGNVNEFTLPDTSIDDKVFGVKAVDRYGNESMVSAYVTGPYRRTTGQ